MPILDAALAFALTMLVVATVVTQIVRFLRNTAKLRNTELQSMLTEYFNQELQPVFKRELNRIKGKISNEAATELDAAANNLQQDKLFKEDELKTLIEVSTEELTERLKRSTFGEKLLMELGDEAKAVFAELGRRYEIVGKKFTESFRKQSRVWATGVALVLALIVNIDSVYILNSYIRSESMRQQVIEQRDAFVGDYNALINSLEKEKNKQSVTKEELKQAFRDSQRQLNILTTVGFPIGWSYFPYSGLQKGESKDFELRNSLGGWVMWGLGILLTAVLAGLGAPFWYDTVTGISRFTQRARALKKPTA